MEIECKQNHFAIKTTKRTESRGKLLDNISFSYVGFGYGNKEIRYERKASEGLFSHIEVRG